MSLKSLLSSLLVSVLVFVSVNGAKAQTNIRTSAEIENILLGNYTASQYEVPGLIDSKTGMVDALLSQISHDSLKDFIVGMDQFKTRHSASDTVSETSGMGAARRWAHKRMSNFNQGKPSVLIMGYLDFDVDICGVMQHRNVIGVVPGTNPGLKEAILIEGHLDSRCESRCDTACIAKGIEDNASGSALVMELARVMSQFATDRTLIFMLTTGEEQGLHGGRALAKYATQKGVKIRAVQNNDVIGGVICGKTASPPGCPGENQIDSTQVRIFSAGAFNSPHKQYARFVKLQYDEEIKSKVKVPMLISIMSAEDRTGRGGDHIPFREENITAIRFTSAHEHGDGHADSEYTDRQHTVGDILGKDTDGDKIIDEYYVDFNYLGRNAQINANAAVMAAIGPETPTFTLTRKYGTILQVRITDPKNYGKYRVALHTSGHEFDTLIDLNGKTDIDITVLPDKFYFVSVASVDGEGTESLFTGEQSTRTNTIDPAIKKKARAQLLDNRPNPFDFATTLAFYSETVNAQDVARIDITNLKGQLVKRIPIDLKPGLNEVLYEHGYGQVGHYIYSLYINDEMVGSKRMIFAN